MPLIAAPNRGYADWQRVENYDSGVLWGGSLASRTATVFGPVLDVSRYEYTGGVIQCTNGAMYAQMTWWADAAATVNLGTRYFTLDGVVPDPMQIRIPNLGPFVSVLYAQIPANNFTPNWQLIGTNRFNPLEMIPSYPMLVNQQSGGLAAGNQTELYPQDYYSGPVLVNTVAISAAMTFTVESLWVDGIYRNVWSATNNAGTSNYTAVVPPGFWKLVINNVGAGAGTWIASVTPSFTGSL